MQPAQRILIALEDLTAQALASFRAGEVAAATATIARMQPLVTWISARAADAQDPVSPQALSLLRSRIDSLDAWLGGELRRMRTELGNARAVERRAATIAPAYARADATSSGTVWMIA